MLKLIVALLVLNLLATVALFVWVSWIGDHVRALVTELGQALKVFRQG